MFLKFPKARKSKENACEGFTSPNFEKICPVKIHHFFLPQISSTRPFRIGSI
jgi:hypothetical protein